MSWHFSQALVEEFLQATSCKNGELFAPLKLTDMPETYCWRDRMTESLDLFQYGMTLQPSTENIGAELLTWFLAGFRALMSVSRGQCGDVLESLEIKAGCGLNTCESLMKCNQNSFGGRIRRNSKPKDLTKLFQRYPPVGMFVNGQLLELTISGYLTQENGFGFSLPTPTTRDWKDTPGMTMNRKDGKSRADRLPMLLFLCVRSAGIKWKQTTNTDAQTVSVKGLNVSIEGREYCPDLPEWLMGWPIGWTDLKPLAMDKFQSWLQQHGEF